MKQSTLTKIFSGTIVAILAISHVQKFGAGFVKTDAEQLSFALLVVAVLLVVIICQRKP